MDILSMITLIGGLAFFLYGMNILSGSLERMAGGRLETALKRMTSNRFKSLFLGAGITAAIQSSSAVTVMLVGLVNSGIMQIKEAIGVIMGSNIGTTMTAWILTLVGIESDNLLISLLKPENFSLIFAFFGVLLIMCSKKTKQKDIGNMLVGFAILMYGMKLMSSAMKPLAELPAFTQLLTAFQNPILGVLAGLIITAIIQSSSASVGILQAMALTKAVSVGAAIPIIMGQNIGTCITALLSSIGVSKNARKVAIVHVSFNLIGTAVCLVIYCVANGIWQFDFVNQPIDAIGIAAIHTMFNVFTTILLLPFTKQLENIANFILPDTSSKELTNTNLLDPRLLATPSIAITECDGLTLQMGKLATGTLQKAFGLLEQYDEDTVEEILKNESMLDRYEDELGTTLVLLSSKRLSDEDSLKASKMLHVIGDFERLGDHAVNLMHSVQELREKDVHFSDSASQELSVLLDAIHEILSITEKAYEENDLSIALSVEPLEQIIDGLVADIRNRHIIRLQSGNCSVVLGFIFSDVLTNLERISDHCSNVAVALLELSHSSFDTHKYLLSIRSKDERYQDALQRYEQKYRLEWPW